MPVQLGSRHIPCSYAMGVIDIVAARVWLVAYQFAYCNRKTRVLGSQSTSRPETVLPRQLPKWVFAILWANTSSVPASRLWSIRCARLSEPYICGYL